MQGTALSVLTQKRSIIVIVLVAIVLVAAVAVTYLTSFQQPQIESITISSINNVSLSGLDLTFAIKISNPNRYDITIKNIKYSLILTQTGQTLMNGTHGEITLPAHGSTEIFLNSTLYSGPAINLAFETVFAKSAMMQVNGGGTAAGLFSDHTFSFSRSFDAYPYISDKLNSLI